MGSLKKCKKKRHLFLPLTGVPGKISGGFTGGPFRHMTG